MSTDFSSAVARMRAAMGGHEPWTMPQAEKREGPSAETLARRKAGLHAYQEAMHRRGVPRRVVQVWASAHPLFADLADD